MDRQLWPRDREIEFPVEACWLSQTQESQTEQIHPQTFDDPFFWQHWHDLHALGFHWTDSQHGILCWGFKGVPQEIPSEASTLEIGSMVFPSGQCTSPQQRGCDDGHWYDHTRGLPWGLPEVFGMVQQVHCSRRRLLRRRLEFHVCTINKSAHTRKVWKLI